ncbi:MAG: hypothetical protein BJ554DRAFT_5266, partial [Olpidium bornovanus]
VDAQDYFFTVVFTVAPKLTRFRTPRLVAKTGGFDHRSTSTGARKAAAAAAMGNDAVPPISDRLRCQANRFRLQEPAPQGLPLCQRRLRQGPQLFRLVPRVLEQTPHAVPGLERPGARRPHPGAVHDPAPVLARRSTLQMQNGSQEDRRAHSCRLLLVCVIWKTRDGGSERVGPASKPGQSESPGSDEGMPRSASSGTRMRKKKTEPAYLASTSLLVSSAERSVPYNSARSATKWYIPTRPV